MNNTNTINATTETEMNRVCDQARTMAKANRLPSFVYQTGRESFAFRFVSECNELGVLVARYDRNGEMC